MSAWETWINARHALPVVAQMALAHYQFETLHPYGDGNGRLGRLIALLQVMKAGELRWPVLNIAPWFETRRMAYQDGLLRTTLTGDFNPWVEFFAEAVTTQARDGLAKIQGLLAIKEQMLVQLRAVGLRGSTIQLGEELIGYPFIDVPTVRDLIGKSFEAANQAVARLVEQGILVETTGRRQNRLFACPEVLKAIRWD